MLYGLQGKGAQAPEEVMDGLFGLSDLVSRVSGGYGVRPDGTTKGQGWLGAIPTADGGVMTELSASSNIGGEEMQYPLITPNQGFRNLSELSMGIPPTPEMYEKAIEHAIAMRMSGRSPYVYEPFKGE